MSNNNRSFYRISLWSILCGFMVMSCSTDTAQKGTGSEGESYVYGMVIDSINLQPLESSQVVLAKVGTAEEGYPILWSDTLLSSTTGDFQTELPDTGTYSIFLQWQNQLHAHLRGIQYSGGVLNLGSIGLYRKIHVSGVFSDLPQCASVWTIFLAEQNAMATLDSNFAFSNLEATPGRGALVLSCGPLSKLWNIVLSGMCTNPILPTLSWTESGESSAQIGRPIVVDSDCMVTISGEGQYNGSGPMAQAP